MNYILQLLPTIKSGYSEDCLKFITDLSADNIKKIQTYLELSGHGPNQLGDYNQCLDLPSSAYYLASDGQFFIGICFSNKCTKDDILNLARAVPILNIQSVIEPATLNRHMDIVGYITIALLALLTLLVAVSTLMKRYRKQGFFVRHDYFSLQRSLKIFKKSNEIKYLNGIKSICFLAVLFGHELFTRLTTMSNLPNIFNQIRKTYTTIVFSYMFAVDVFFYIGAFMLGFLFVKMYKRKPANSMFFKAIIQRYLRIAPLFLITMLIYWKVMPFVGFGPLLYMYDPTVEACPKAFWRDLLFFGNFTDIMCMPWAWYLQIDMQLFILSIGLLWLYLKVNRRVCYLLMMAIVISGMSFCFSVCYKNNYHVIGGFDVDGMLNPNEANSYLDIYNKPWSRTGPYLIGLMTGLYYAESKRKQGSIYNIYTNRIVRLISLVFGFFLIGLLVFLPETLLHQKPWSTGGNCSYMAFSRTLFVVGLSLVTLPMLVGFTNPFKIFLEWSFWQHLSKLAYSGYLIHYSMLLGFVLNVKTSQYVDPPLEFISGFMDVVPILAVALFLSITVEFPFGALFDSIFKKNKQQ